MQRNHFLSAETGRRVTMLSFAVGLFLALTAFAAPSAYALRDPVPIAQRAVRERLRQDHPNRRNIEFFSTRVRRGSGHTRFVRGTGSFGNGRRMRRFTYSVNVDTGNGAVNGVTVNTR